MQNKRQTGARYEKLAGAFLEENGCQILEYNYYFRGGEIDLILKDGEYLVFCEVKYRKDESKGSPLEAVDLRKQRSMIKGAGLYLVKAGLFDVPCRFDVIGICGEKVEWIQNAFEAF